jgi:neutral trehalase
MNAAESEQLIARAVDVLHGNDLGGWTKPAPGLYPHQWNWDSCFIAIGLARVDPQRAATELRSLLRGQWTNGMVPQIVFDPRATGYFPGPDVWQSERSPDSPTGVPTSGITQPPVLATAIRAVYEQAVESEAPWATAFAEEMYPKAFAYHRFFYEQRCPDGDGLVVVVHPWESGLDNSPPYLDAGERVHLAYKPHYERLDLLHVAASNRPTNKDYDLFVYLLELMREDDWNQTVYLSRAPLQVQDVLFNSILCRAHEDLIEIGTQIGRDTSDLVAWKRQTTEAINRELWDEDTGTYLSRDRVAQRLISDDTIAAFGTLYGGVAPDNRTDVLLLRLQDPERFAPPHGHPVPTTSLLSPRFNPANYWLGPTWIATNWLIVRGLETSRHPELAEPLLESTIRLVADHGFREYYNPGTGEPYGADHFSWTAALTIDLLQSRGPAGPEKSI